MRRERSDAEKQAIFEESNPLSADLHLAGRNDNSGDNKEQDAGTRKETLLRTE